MSKNGKFLIKYKMHENSAILLKLITKKQTLITWSLFQRLNICFSFLLLVGTTNDNYDMKPINNTLGIFYLNEYRIIISNIKWTRLIQGNITALQDVNTNNKLLEIFTKLSAQVFLQCIFFLLKYKLIWTY